MYNRGDYEKAREFYREALQNDSSCVEALYNSGINHKLYDIVNTYCLNLLICCLSCLPF